MAPADGGTEVRMIETLLWGLIGFALGGLAALARLSAVRAAHSADRVSPRTLARLRQAQEEDR